jgi:hypothetical protein
LECASNNLYYRIRELTLPASASTGLLRFEFKTTFLPHSAGRLLVKTQGLERDTEVIMGQAIAFASGTENEIMNATDQELRFTVAEFK